MDEGVALEMARGVRRMFGADVALATTGVAGPGTADGHEAGTVWVAVDSARGSRAALARFPGGREDVRRAAVRRPFSENSENVGKRIVTVRSWKDSGRVKPAKRSGTKSTSMRCKG